MTATKRRWLPHSIALTATLLAVGGCDTPVDDPTEPPAATPSELNRVNGDVLHVIKAGNNHTIEFYKLKHGQNAVFESYPLDVGSLIGKVKDTTSLAAVFQALRPGETTPAVLLSADKYAADMLAAENFSQREPGKAARLTPSVTTLENNEIGTRSDALSFPTRGQPTCSTDGFNDNWGAEWFTTNFCNGENFQHCFTNSQPMARYANGRFKWVQFTGDFNVPGLMETWHWDCRLQTCELILDRSWIVNPRSGAEYTYTTPGWHGGRGNTGNCPHMHVYNGSERESQAIDVNQPGLSWW
jgi:hypothetical protein